MKIIPIKNKTLKSSVLTAFFLICATLFSLFLHYLVPLNTANAALAYILALVLVARYTQSYVYCFVTTLFSVVFINYFFTYPFFKFNFSLTGYPLTFIVMIIISLIIGTFTTHLKHQAEMLSEHEKKLMEAEKEKMRANLLRAISHDLRTPLTSIIGSACAYLENKDDFGEEDKTELINKINDDANWLLNMVENLLSVTRIQNGSAKVSKNPEAVEEVVSEAVLRLRKRIPEAEIKVSVPDDFLMIPMDAMLIEQVLINLAENAILHSQSAAPTEITVTENENYVVFCVKDYGTGINEEEITALLNGMPVESLNSGDIKRGMGIGLSICKTIITAHNGEITAKNMKKGAEFIFKLPKRE